MTHTERTNARIGEIGDTYYGAGECLLATHKLARELAAELDKAADYCKLAARTLPQCRDVDIKDGDSLDTMITALVVALTDGEEEE